MKNIEDFKIGDHVIIKEVNEEDYKGLIGKVVTVMYSDIPNKIKISFDDQWCGYFLPDQLDFYDKTEIQKKLMTQIVFASEKYGKLCEKLENNVDNKELIEKEIDEVVANRKKLIEEFWRIEK